MTRRFLARPRFVLSTIVGESGDDERGIVRHGVWNARRKGCNEREGEEDHETRRGVTDDSARGGEGDFFSIVGREHRSRSPI